MASAANLDPHMVRHGEALDKLAQYCMDHLPTAARDEFIRLYKELGDAWLDEAESNVNLLRAKNARIAQLKSEGPSAFGLNRRN